MAVCGASGFVAHPPMNIANATNALDGTFHLCHIFLREAPSPAMLDAFKLSADPV
jgi:hypothetical protein